MPMDLDALLRPIEGDRPAGIDLRSETGINSLYFKLKDARAQARTLERATEAASETPTVPAEWHVVRTLALEALATRTKDLEIAAWLIEALVRLEGFAGLSEGFVISERLIERFWPDLHSIDEDDAVGRVSPLAGLNGIGGDGALVQPIRMVSLLPDTPYGSHALWHVARVQKAPDSAAARDFNDARAAAGMAAIRERALEASTAREAFVSLNMVLESLCGADAPPSSNIRNALDDVIDSYRGLIGGAVEIPTAPVDTPVEKTAHAPPVKTAEGPAAGAPQALPPRDLTTREEAFTELLRVADFFRRNEPHSPISYALETLVWRGRMNFIDLLEELMPDMAHRKQVLQHAGIHANAEAKTRSQ